MSRIIEILRRRQETTSESLPAPPRNRVLGDFFKRILPKIIDTTRLYHKLYSFQIFMRTIAVGILPDRCHLTLLDFLGFVWIFQGAIF